MIPYQPKNYFETFLWSGPYFWNGAHPTDFMLFSIFKPKNVGLLSRLGPIWKILYFDCIYLIFEKGPTLALLIWFFSQFLSSWWLESWKEWNFTHLAAARWRLLCTLFLLFWPICAFSSFLTKKKHQQVRNGHGWN